MKKYVFFSALAVLFIGLLGVIAYMVVDATKSEVQTPLKVAQGSKGASFEEKQSQEEVEPTWQEKLSLIKPKDYTPAAERFSMVFEVDTSIFRSKSKYYQLIIDKNDVYSMFCLKQTLNSYEVKYSLMRTTEATEIFLETDKQALIDEIVARLKHYEINAKFEEVWL